MRYVDKTDKLNRLLYHMASAHSFDPDNHPGVKPDCFDIDNWADMPSYDENIAFICGFESIVQLRQWFGRYLRGLLRQGFHIASYRVAKKYIRTGKKQVCFAKAGRWKKLENLLTTR
jgi:hypothetical protein